MKNRNQIIIETIVQILEAEGETPPQIKRMYDGNLPAMQRLSTPQEQTPKPPERFIVDKDGKKIDNPKWDAYIRRYYPAQVEPGRYGDVARKYGGI
jgi:hypothetical protein